MGVQQTPTIIHLCRAHIKSGLGHYQIRDLMDYYDVGHECRCKSIFICKSKIIQSNFYVIYMKWILMRLDLHVWPP